MVLCSTCDLIFRGQFTSSEPKDAHNISWRDHHFTAEQFEDSVLKSCLICMIVCERLRGGVAALENKYRMPQLPIGEKLQQSESPTPRTQTAFSKYAFKPGPRAIGAPGYDGLLIEIVRSRPIIGMSNVLFNLVPQKEKVALDSDFLNPSPEWPLDLGKRWLQDCKDKHQCQKADSPSWMPTRLLELDKPKVGMLRLVHTPRIESKTQNCIPYITLSHCWGKINLQKLEQATSEKLSKGILVTNLHQTFRDAVKVALYLGMNHIWIDCLCIYQDSVADWTHESSLMGKVYKHGVCNISATAAGDAKAGLFQQRGSAMFQDSYHESHWDDRANRHWRIAPANFLAKWLLDGPALYRAWVVQERILAPRVLHFGKRQLYWECQDFDACETYPSGVPKFVSGESNRPNPFKTKGFNTTVDISSSAVAQKQATNEILRSWREIVNVYAECQLTVASDKLIAISGLAKSVQESLGGAEYLAGLWRMSLLTDLSWGTYLKRGTRPLEYRAPSWSWASIDGQILDWGRRGKDREFLAELKIASIVEASVQLRTDDKTGRVEGGVLRIRGPMLTLGDFDNDAGSASSEAKINGVRLHRLLRAQVDVDVKGENLHVLPLTWHNRKRLLLDCLLLQPTGVKRGEFRRYGLVELDREVYKIDSLSIVNNEPWMEWEDELGDGTYSISII